MRKFFKGLNEKIRRDIEDFLDVPEAPPVNWKVAGPGMMKLWIIAVSMFMFAVYFWRMK